MTAKRAKLNELLDRADGWTREEQNGLPVAAVELIDELSAAVKELLTVNDEAEASLAYIRVGSVDADRDELVRRITAVDEKRFHTGSWLAERDSRIRAEERQAVRDA